MSSTSSQSSLKVVEDIRRLARPFFRDPTEGDLGCQKGSGL